MKGKLKLKLVSTLCGDVCGISTFNDGVKAYWVEGRSSDIVFLRPDGTSWAEPVYKPTSVWGKWMDANPDFVVPQERIRDMTEAEEADYDAVRNAAHYIPGV